MAPEESGDKGGVASPPTMIAIPGNGKITVAWRGARQNGGGHPQKYEAAATPDSTGLAAKISATTKTCVVTPSSTADTLCTITGLTNGVAYHVGVRAYFANAGGWIQVHPVRPTELPNAPLQVAAYPSNGLAQVAWTASLVAEGDAAVTGYTVAAVEDPAKSCATTTDSTCDVTGLTNGNSYTFRVTALRSATGSLPSIPTPAVTPGPVTLPSPPLALKVLNAGYGPVQGTGPQIFVRWNAPRFLGGSVITGYTVTATSADPAVAPVTKTVGADSQGTALIVGRGGEYTVAVKATNATGTGPAALQYFRITGAAAAPFAPTGITVAADTGFATISWSAPFSGGAFITGYFVTVDGAPGRACETSAGTGGRPLFCRVDGLENNRSYVFRVRAVNSVDTGAAGLSDSVAMPKLYPPGVPTNLTGVELVGAVELSWNHPAYTGGSRITGYKAMAVQDTAKSCEGPGTGTLSGPRSSCAIHGLMNRARYTFVVRALNAIGASGLSAASDTLVPHFPVSIPGAPTALTGVVGAGQVALSWTAPAYDGDADIIGYVVTEQSDTSKGCTTTGATSCTVTGLAIGVDYFFSVKALNIKGASQASTGHAVFLRSAPGTPTDVRAAGGQPGEATILWEAGPSGGSVIQEFVVTAVEDNTKKCTSTQFYECTVTGLAIGVPYTFVVTAKNAIGTSPVSASSAPYTSISFPDVPVNVTAVPGNGSATISWALGFNGGLEYQYSRASVAGDETKFCVTSGAGASCNIWGLVNGTAYSFTVIANNGRGDSAPSAPSAPVTPLQSP